MLANALQARRVRDQRYVVVLDDDVRQAAHRRAPSVTQLIALALNAAPVKLVRSFVVVCLFVCLFVCFWFFLLSDYIFFKK